MQDKKRGELKEHKFLLSLILLLVILGGVIGYLFYAGILTTVQLQSLWNNTQSSLFKSYTSLLNWIVQNYIYLVAVALAVIIGTISYLKRGIVKKIFEKTKEYIDGHKLFFLTLAGSVIVVGGVFYLFYSEIIKTEKLQGLGNSVINWFNNLIK